MKRIFHLRKDTRRRLVWLVTVMLLWQQMAVAAYACVVTPPAAAAATPVQTSTMAMSHDCEHMLAATVEPLCTKHCQPDRVTHVEARVASVPLNALAALPPTLLSLATVLPPTERTLARVDRLLAPPPTPRLLFCSLLI